MILVSWNCAGAFRTKFRALTRLDADIYVVQECEDPARSKHNDYRQWASNYLWVGANKNSGLGVFGRSGIRIERLPLDSGKLELFLPCKINDVACLLAVWTKQANSPTFQYIGQLWKLIQLHGQTLAKAPLLVVGDLNSNVRWDKWDRWWNHSDVVRELGALGTESAYHHVRSVAQGAEPEPTFFLQRNPQKSYHIDYAFLPATWLNGCSVSIGDAANWIMLSDHMPVKVAFNITK
jgi:exonuclease III